MKLGKLLLGIVIVSLIVSMAIPMAAAPKPDKPGGGKPGGEDPPADPVIAYRGRQGKDYTLNVMNADGSNQAIVYRQYLGIGTASWSPDGSSIAVDVNVRRDGVYLTDLYRIDISIVDGVPQGSEPIVLAQDIDRYEVAWSPAGDVIAFKNTVNGYKVIQTVPATGGTVETIYTAQEGYGIGSFAWSNDASKMAIASGSSGVGSIFILDLSDGTTRTVKGPSTESGGFLDWARTKDVLAFYLIPTVGEAGIYLLDLTETSPTPELIWADGTSRSPSWSPDDSQLVFETGSGPKKGQQIAVYTFSTEEIEYHALGMHPDWCRDIQQ